MLVKTGADIVLEILPKLINGTVNTSITSGTARIFTAITGSEVEALAPTALVEDVSSNIWRYIWSSPGLTAGNYVIEYTLTDGVITGVYTENLSVGFMQEEIEKILNIETGRWQITGNQLIFFEPDGTTEITRFNLFDDTGTPTEESPVDRVPVP